MLFTGLVRSVLVETVPKVLSTESTVASNTDQWITFLFFSNWDLKVSGNFSSLSNLCVEVGRVRVDEARDRSQTKTKHYNMIFSSVIYIMALTALF